MSYGPLRPVRLPDGRVAAFIMARYHVGCCRDATVLIEDGSVEHHDPETLQEIEGAGTLDRRWYSWSGEAWPEANDAFPELQRAADVYSAMTLDERLALRAAKEPTYIAWRWAGDRCGPWWDDRCQIPLELRSAVLA